MGPKSEEYYKKLFTEIIQKQFVILGPDITIAKVRNVPGITLDKDGNVTHIEGDPKVLLNDLINQFVELSGLILQKTIQSILLNYPGVHIGPVSNNQPSTDYTQKVRIEDTNASKNV